MKLLPFRRRSRRRADLSALPRLNVEAELLDAPDPLDFDDEEAWWATPYGRWRLAAEVTAMRRFPSFRPVHLYDEGICWQGRLRSGLTRRSYLVRVTYPDEFPDVPPSVQFLSPTLPEGVPHLLSMQKPCLYRGPQDGYDPGSTTAATLVAWTALWIHAFETWQATGVWPGAGD